MSNIISNPEEFEEEATMCERCNCCEMMWEECNQCGGVGKIDEEIEDGEIDYYKCDICEGYGGWYRCTCDENGKHKH